MHGFESLDMLHAASAITKTTGLPNAITQEVQLCTPSVTTTHNLELGDQRRMNRPSLLDSDLTNHATHSHILINPTPLTNDHRTLVNLNAFLLAFDDPEMHIDRIPNIKTGNIRLECAGVD